MHTTEKQPYLFWEWRPRSDFPKSQMYGRNLFKKSIVSKVVWDPSPSLEQEKENVQNVLSGFPVLVVSFTSRWQLLLGHFLWFWNWSLIGSLVKTLLCSILWRQFSFRPGRSMEDGDVPRGVSQSLSPASRAAGSWTGSGVGLMPGNSHSLSFIAKDNAASGRTLMQKHRCQNPSEWKTAWFVPPPPKQSPSFPTAWARRHF